MSISNCFTLTLVKIKDMSTEMSARILLGVPIIIIIYVSKRWQCMKWSHHKLSKILYCIYFTILYLILSHRIWSYYQSYHQDMILIHSCKTSNCLLGPCNPFCPEMNIWHEKKNQYNTINVHNFTYQSRNN